MKVAFNIALFTSIYLLLSGCAIGFIWPTAKVEVVVVDEDGKPIQGADVVIGFDQPGLESRTEGVRGLSDSNGRFAAKKVTTGTIHYGATKEGYYKSHYKKEIGSYTPGLKRFDPVEFTIVMRKILNPIPMYGRNNQHNTLTIPVLEESVGFDLIKYDWVSPYGSGEISDFIFKLNREYRDRRNYDVSLELTFSNKNDGIIIKEEQLHGSEFILPREAPINGYVDKIIVSKKASEEKKELGSIMSFKNDDNYIFRVRSKVDESGSIIAMYGKIVGPISIGGFPFTDTSLIWFKYYLNPDFTRNLEFDPKNNLFGELPFLEQVGTK